MTVFPINGKNERMGKLFKAPKHLLLKDGLPAIERSVNYMTNFGAYVILCNGHNEEGLRNFNRIVVPESRNVIETLVSGIPPNFHTDLWIVDCDVITIYLNKPKTNTVFVFENKARLPHYSNYEINEASQIVSCNEKEAITKWAGAGVYYFTGISLFLKHCIGAQSVCEVYQNMIRAGHKVMAEANNEIFRFGTLNDINGI